MSNGHFIISPSVQFPSRFRFTFTTPLFKEKRHVGIRTLIANVNDPFFLSLMELTKIRRGFFHFSGSSSSAGTGTTRCVHRGPALVFSAKPS